MALIIELIVVKNYRALEISIDNNTMLIFCIFLIFNCVYYINPRFNLKIISTQNITI